MTFCLHVNMFFCGFMERLFPSSILFPSRSAAGVKLRASLMVAGSWMRLDVQDLLDVFLFFTVAFFSTQMCRSEWKFSTKTVDSESFIGE